jgi:hypothetical protein
VLTLFVTPSIIPFWHATGDGGTIINRVAQKVSLREYRFFCPGIPHVGISGRTISKISIDKMVGWRGSAYQSL